MDIMKMGQNPNFLGSWDLEELPNREITLIIDRFADEEVVTNGKSETVTVCYWTDKAVKPMILNLTNKKALARLYKTKMTEKLEGKAVVIGIDKIKAFGDVWDALRIRGRIPQMPKADAPKCDNCKKPIAPYGKMNPEQLAKYTKEKYGACLCGTCAAELAKAVEGK